MRLSRGSNAPRRQTVLTQRASGQYVRAKLIPEAIVTTRRCRRALSIISTRRRLTNGTVQRRASWHPVQPGPAALSFAIPGSFALRPRATRAERPAHRSTLISSARSNTRRDRSFACRLTPSISNQWDGNWNGYFRISRSAYQMTRKTIAALPGNRATASNSAKVREGHNSSRAVLFVGIGVRSPPPDM